MISSKKQENVRRLNFDNPNAKSHSKGKGNLPSGLLCVSKMLCST